MNQTIISSKDAKAIAFACISSFAILYFYVLTSNLLTLNERYNSLLFAEILCLIGLGVVCISNIANREPIYFMKYKEDWSHIAKELYEGKRKWVFRKYSNGVHYALALRTTNENVSYYCNLPVESEEIVTVPRLCELLQANATKLDSRNIENMYAIRKIVTDLELGTDRYYPVRFGRRITPDGIKFVKDKHE